MLDPEMMRAKNVLVGRVIELEDDGRHDIVGGDE